MFFVKSCRHLIFVSTFNAIDWTNGNFMPHTKTVILATLVPISPYMINLKVITIKTIGHRPQSDYLIKRYHQIKF